MNLEFATAVKTLATEVTRDQAFAFFLGAGASNSAGAPTGAIVIEEVRRDLFAQAIGRATYSPEELAKWWAAQTWRTGNDYHDVLRQYFPDPGMRRDYFEARLSGLRPSSGHRALARLMTAASTRALLSRVITTNFDWLIESALAQETNEFPFVYDQAHHLPSQLSVMGAPTVLKVHGDYYYDDIANLEEELNARMEGSMRNALQQAVRRTGLILLGYSGSDAALRRELTVLLDPASEYLSGGVWWIHPMDRTPPNGAAVIAKVRATGRTGYLIPVPDDAFNTFVTSLEAALVSGVIPARHADPIARYVFQLRQSLSSRAFRQYPQELSTPPPNPQRLGSGRLLEYCAAGSAVVVIGEAGCGKTSTLVTLALDLLNAGRLPILCQVSRSSTEPELDATQAEIVRLAPGRSVLLIDGLDEASQPDAVLMRIPEVVARYGCPVLVASRPLPQLAGYSPRFEFTPLSREEIRDFVATVWSDRLAEQFESELGRASSSRPNLVEVCRNPMTLRMASTVFFRTGDLAGKCRLYDDLIRLRLQFYQHRVQTPEAELREAAERLGYYAEKPGARARTLSHALAAATGRLDVSDEDERLADGLLSCGLVRRVRDDWDFLHRSYQPYFAARAVLRELEGVPPTFRLVGEILTTSEVNEFLGSYFDERVERMNHLFSILGTGGPAYTGTNLRYVLSFCRNHPGRAKEFVRAELTSDRWENPRTTVQEEQRILNAALAGLMAGDDWCVGVWLSILLRDRCDDSWNICRYAGRWHNPAAPQTWQADDSLKKLQAVDPSSTDTKMLRELIMHSGHLASQNALQSREEFREAIERLSALSWKPAQYQVVMNIILALYRFNDERALDIILTAFGGDRGISLNWRIPRSVLLAVLHLAPSNSVRRQRAADLIGDLLPRLRTTEAYQRQFLQVQCILALTRMRMSIPADLDETPAIDAARRWSVMHASAVR